MTVVPPDTPLTCVGDIMLELITQREMASDYQRTLILDGRETAIGGAVCNLVWYFSQLGLSSAMVSHYGEVDRERVHQLLSEPNVASNSLVEKPGVSDLLIVVPRIKMPAIYVTGHLDDSQASVMSQGLVDEGFIIFGGSRHNALRHAFLNRTSTFQRAKIVFSPSYTLYDYGDDEIARFLRASDIAVVNEDEAEYLTQKIASNELDAIMRLPKEGGIVTRGPLGADLYYQTLPRLRTPSVSGRKQDVVGAGEAFLCGFLHSLMVSGRWVEAGEWGCAVAAQVVLDGRVRAPIDRNAISAHFG
jgi:sugar/nucleoside kinase (ribokinase family)